MPTTPKKRRKPKAARKELGILIRVTEDQKKVLANAAEQAGLDLSSWLRALGMREAKQQGSKGDESPAAEPREGEPAEHDGDSVSKVV